MSLKSVKVTLPGEKIDMGGFPVKQALPTNNVDQVDPFLLLHHARVKPNYDRTALSQGVGPHPHRGFSPVTFVIEGEVHHRDSKGNSQVAKKGEVQWINAGAGIVHSERPSQNLVDEKGVQEIIQLWINSPAKYKMTESSYIHVDESNIPRIKSEDGLSDIKLISGKYGDSNGKIDSFSELLILWVSSSKGATLNLEVPIGFNSTVYSIKGGINVKGYGMVDPESLLVFSEDGNRITINSTSNSQFLFLAGMPINEPMAQYGPFVMNNQTEIMEAMRDYQIGKMGILIEEN